MDIICSKPLAHSEIAADIAGKQGIVGAKQLRRGLKNGAVARVYLAVDADPAITEPILALCQQYDIEVAWARSKTDLGKAFGIDVGAAVAATVK